MSKKFLIFLKGNGAALSLGGGNEPKKYLTNALNYQKK